MLSISENMIIRMSFVVLLLVAVQLILAIAVADSGVRCREEEKHALLDFKLSFTADPLGLSSWTIHSPECCDWEGVDCDYRTGHVESLSLSVLEMESHQLRPSLLVLQHLTSLDLSGNTFTMRIPEFIGNLPKLTLLALSHSGFFGKIPPHLGNLTSLQTLFLDDSSTGLLHADNLQWLSHLSSLHELYLSGVNLSNATDWLSTLKMLPSLSWFLCSSCSLPNVPPPPVSSLCLPNRSTSLQALVLSHTNISPVTFSCLIKGTFTLNTLHLANMNSEQNVHEYLEALIQSVARYALEGLDISGNNLNRIPLSLTMFPLLTQLDISHNQLSEFMVPHKLDISYNLSKFSSLTALDASFNKIGSLHAILQHLPTNLSHLYLIANSLTDVISDSHLSNFPNLKVLYLSDNYLLTFNFSRSWVPPFQLFMLHLRSCKLGPAFPNWVLTQTSLYDLDISNSSISGAIPNAFWNFSTTIFLSLNVSNNKLLDTIPNVSTIMYKPLIIIDLSSNDLHGPIPLFMFSARGLDLSNNEFSSFPSFPFHHQVSNHDPGVINISNKLLSDTLSTRGFQFDALEVLNLANNKLSGTIPSNMPPFLQLSELHLNNNRLSGELPSSMKNCTQLQILELANNNFSGSVPVWLGDSLQRLVVLSLRSNNFTGDLPSNLCRLQSLQVLDLSSNRISGSIPGCVNNFTSMIIYQGFNYSRYYTIATFSTLPVYASIMWKGILANESGIHLLQWNVIDLSNNCLTGEIPSGVTSLKYLRSLDLSRNNLNASIPDKIGQLKFLEVLKLSANRLCGDIPQSLADLNSLCVLNLSSNNLSGRIPTSTQLQSFDPSSYAGNAELCGDPLPTKCPGDKDAVKPPPFVRDPTEEEEEANNESFDVEAFCAALGAGFAFGLWGILGILNFHAPSRHAFFHMATEVGDWIFVKTFLCQSRIKRSLGF